MTLQMHNPPRPGQIIRELCLEPLGLSVTEAAEGLGVNGEKDEQEPSG
jgi:plasmid maintenance system antidote protein VapI